ncbi:hypothetical protein DAI22_02g065100 [Oryza sativa Japonica Group]|nr:hypothetical protein DAI22_02g065100 [Oryza sativa Japonica Group]
MRGDRGGEIGERPVVRAFENWLLARRVFDVMSRRDAVQTVQIVVLAGAGCGVCYGGVFPRGKLSHSQLVGL